MAIFGRKKEEKKAPESAAAPAVKKAAPVRGTSATGANTHVLLAPRVTEKAAILSDSGVYVFTVTRTATKPQVASAIQDLFKVTPRKVRMVVKHGTRVTTRITGKKGMTAASKKAYVYLKKGDKIELA